MSEDPDSERTETIRIAIPRKLMDEVKSLVADGFFINAGELMRSALLLYLARLHDVIAMIWTETPPESEE